VLEELRGLRAHVINTNEIAINIGNLKAANVAIFGYLHSLRVFKEIEEEAFIKALKYESNVKALMVSFSIAKTTLV